jgi:4-hydroxy-3-methylbut-2-enyl diphosphate reductase
MKVKRANVLGFCMGVRRAVELAFEEAKRAQASGSHVCALGSLIHNPKVLADLKALGVETLDELPDNGCRKQSFVAKAVIIRAHGISPDLENDLRVRGCRIIDATCPNVKANQIKIQEFSHAGYNLFIAGETNHAEITGLLGYAESAPYCTVVGNTDEARKAASALYKISPDVKTALLGQTTISEEEFRDIGDAINLFFPNLEIVQTICGATTERQQALRDLLAVTDAVIIAGGKESANTRRLLAIARKSGKPCALVEHTSDIPSFFRNYKTIGLSAGASTPDSVIDEIEAALLNA